MNVPYSQDYKYTPLLNYQLELWGWLLNHQVELQEYITNPLRIDNYPGCWLSFSLKNPAYIVLNDFADKSYHGINVFEAVMRKYNVSFKRAVGIIYENYVFKNNLILQNKPKIHYKKTGNFVFKLNYKPKSFTLQDKRYWEPMDISSKQLDEDLVVSVKEFTYNTRWNPQTMFYERPFDPCYSYHINDHMKIYRPFMKGIYKWKSNCTERDIPIDHLREDEFLIITKSYKDHRILRNLGYESTWVQSEGTLIPLDLIKLFSKNYKHIIILYDNDKGGRKAAKKIVDYCNNVVGYNQFYQLFYEDELDTAEHYLKDGADYIIETIENGLQEMQLEQMCL